MNPPNIKYYKFYGDSPDLVTGEKYPMKKYAEVSGISAKRLNNRRRRHKNPPIDDAFLLDLYVREAHTLESETDVVSDSWLRRKLV